MTQAQIKEAQTLLNANGFPCGPVDGQLGPSTYSAINLYRRAYAGAYPGIHSLRMTGELTRRTRLAMLSLPNLSANFAAAEFACRHCGKAYVHRRLIRGLERLRKELGKPLTIVSGYRCPEHNKAVGGDSNSQHLYGSAADLNYPTTLAKVREMNFFSGLGHKNGQILHVDVRYVSDNNTTGGTPDAPTIWSY